MIRLQSSVIRADIWCRSSKAYCEVWMCKRVADIYTALGVKRQALFHEVESQRVRIGKELAERLLLSEGKGADIFSGSC